MINRRFFLRGLAAMPAIVPIRRLMRLSVAPKLIYPAYGRSPCMDALPDCLELQRLTKIYAQRWAERFYFGDPDAGPTAFQGFIPLADWPDYVPATPAGPEDPDIAPPA
jgi:hypothetical protein